MVELVLAQILAIVRLDGQEMIVLLLSAQGTVMLQVPKEPVRLLILVHASQVGLAPIAKHLNVLKDVPTGERVLKQTLVPVFQDIYRASTGIVLTILALTL